MKFEGDLVTNYNWAHNHTSHWDDLHKSPVGGTISRVRSSAISSYQVLWSQTLKSLTLQVY